MLTLSNTKVLHLEPTDACNAACPQCARETDTNFNKSNLHHLTVEDILQKLSIDVIKNLDKMYMCGNYGDPAAGKYTLDIYKYFRSVNPTITLGMNTNGGLRSTSWWKSLAKIMHQPGEYPKEYVIFSIDGLEDTNHIYRVNVNWSKVIENAKAFIDAGGLAHWEMLVFEHNQHQVEKAQQLAKDLGFKWFRAKVSKRHNLQPVSFLSHPKGWIDPVVNKGHIDCQALRESGTYMSATGTLYPCCWLGTSDYTLDTFNDVQHSWNNNPNIICKQTCTKNITGTSFSNQWQHEVEF
jgi:MoaA/NifB/PqqE/SkfB family radical SAM enzyme